MYIPLMMHDDTTETTDISVIALNINVNMLRTFYCTYLLLQDEEQKHENCAANLLSGQ